MVRSMIWNPVGGGTRSSAARRHSTCQDRKDRHNFRRYYGYSGSQGIRIPLGVKLVSVILIGMIQDRQDHKDRHYFEMLRTLCRIASNTRISDFSSIALSIK